MRPERRYLQRHIREQKARPGDWTIEDLKAMYHRFGEQATELQFRIAMMPDGCEKIRAMLLACEVYIRREEIALTVDYRLAKAGK